MCSFQAVDEHCMKVELKTTMQAYEIQASLLHEECEAAVLNAITAHFTGDQEGFQEAVSIYENTEPQYDQAKQRLATAVTIYDEYDCTCYVSCTQD